MPTGAKESPRCLIVDDHPVVRAGVRAVLEQAFRALITDAASVEDVARAPNGEAPRRGDRRSVARRRATSAEVVGRLRERGGAPIVVFTSDGGARLLGEALKAGVKGYVRKDSPSEDLIRAIDAARAGEFYVDPALSSTIVLDEGDRTLSARQREILQMLADGMQTDAVAQKLGLSTETVRTHTKRILAKLEARHAHAGRGDRHPPRPDRVSAQRPAERQSSPLNRRRLADALRRRILDGELSPGTPLRRRPCRASTTWRGTRCARPLREDRSDRTTRLVGWQPRPRHQPVAAAGRETQTRPAGGATDVRRARWPRLRIRLAVEVPSQAAAACPRAWPAERAEVLSPG